MAAWDITWKDLRLLVKDKRAVTLLVLLPMMFISIIGMAAGQFLTKDEDQKKLKIAVVDEDKSEPSIELVKALSRHEGVKVLERDSQAAATETLDKNEATVALTIPNTYEEKIEELGLEDVVDSEYGQLRDGPDALGLDFRYRSAAGDGGVVPWLVFSDAMRTLTPFVVKRKGNPVLRAAVHDEEERQEAIAGDKTDVTQTAPEEEKKSDQVYMILVPGFTVMFVFFLINIMARSFIAERDQGTLRRLKLAPISSASVLIGKTLPFYLTSVLQVSMLFLAGRMLFDMSWGPDPVYLVPVILCTSLAATSLGLLLATMVHTDQQVSSYGTSLVLVLGGVSGCMFPRVWLPAGMKTLSLLTPHAWALEAFDAVLTRSQVNHAIVFDQCAVLLGFAAVFFCLGWWKFRSSN